MYAKVSLAAVALVAAGLTGAVAPSAFSQTLGSVGVPASPSPPPALIESPAAAPVTPGPVAPGVPLSTATAATPQRATARRSPTIDELSQAQVMEQEIEVRKRIAKSLGEGGPHVDARAAAGAASTPPAAAVASAPVVARPVPVVVPKMVTAIYGPIGREVAEIQTDDGVQVVQPGSRVGGYRVARINGETVELAPAEGRRGTKSKAGTISLAVGGTFK